MGKHRARNVFVVVGEVICQPFRNKSVVWADSFRVIQALVTNYSCSPSAHPFNHNGLGCAPYSTNGVSTARPFYSTNHIHTPLHSLDRRKRNGKLPLSPSHLPNPCTTHSLDKEITQEVQFPCPPQLAGSLLHLTMMSTNES